MTLSLDTLMLLQQLLHGTTLNGEAPDFEEAALRVLTARRELAETIAVAVAAAAPAAPVPNRAARRHPPAG